VRARPSVLREAALALRTRANWPPA